MEFLLSALIGAKINFTMITAEVTMYSKIETCPYTQCITASGRKIDASDTDVIACPREYKFGTRVIINGKEYVCEDRTAKRYNGRWDIWNGDDYQGALEWGRQTKTLLIYN
jgi:hypothetical protein